MAASVASDADSSISTSAPSASILTATCRAPVRLIAQSSETVGTDIDTPPIAAPALVLDSTLDSPLHNSTTPF